MTFLLPDYFLTVLSAVLCPGYRNRGRIKEIEGRKNYESEKMLVKQRRE